MEGNFNWFNWIKQPDNKPEKTAFYRGWVRGFVYASLVWIAIIILLSFFVL
jgi:hypothetical protein